MGPQQLPHLRLLTQAATIVPLRQLQRTMFAAGWGRRQLLAQRLLLLLQHGLGGALRWSPRCCSLPLIVGYQACCRRHSSPPTAA